MPESTEADTIIEIAQQAARPTPLAGDDTLLYTVLVPQGDELKIVDLIEYEDAPRRKAETVTLHDAVSFIAYTTKHAQADVTSVFADVDHVRITGVVNGHGAITAGWGDHRAILTLKHTLNWQHWAGKDKTWMTQTAFAEHIEEGVPDIVEPPAADMLEIAQTFQANTKVDFKSSVLLNNGQRQFSYVETIESKAGAQGKLTVPTAFKLGVAVFEGGEAYGVVARLQTRIDDGNLKLRYLLDRPADVIRAAFDDVVAVIEAETTKAYRGTPPDPA